MTIIPLDTVECNDFNKETLKILKPYFDIDHRSNQKTLWFNNLLTLATHSLGIAHCVQHNHGARLCMSISFADTTPPLFYQSEYEKQIGCWSNKKMSDSLSLKGNLVSGKKYWISNLYQGDYGIFTIPTGTTVNNSAEEAYVLFDFTSGDHPIDLSFPNLIGMEIARAGSLIVDNYQVPDGYILGKRHYFDTNSRFSQISSWTDYGFITNYLGCIVGLFDDLKNHTSNKKINIDYELRNIGLEISSLKMMWTDNLDSVEQTSGFTDKFWHRRNTQYTQSKNILLKLINLVLQTADSRWWDANGAKNQRFRDALVFSTHMKPLYTNLQEKHFIQF